MRLLVAQVVILAWVFTAPARADVGIGAALGSDDETILVPIRLSSLIVEPYFGFREIEFDGGASTASEDTLEVGVGIFGLSTRGENLSIYYGARLAGISEDGSSRGGPNTFPRTQTDVDGYRVTPAVGFQYTISRVMIGAEMGWTYEETDLTSVTTSNNSFTPLRFESTTVSQGIHANVVFRFFF
jgi:hypothetical protein